jgi:hypothetical protein
MLPTAAKAAPIPEAWWRKSRRLVGVAVLGSGFGSMRVSPDEAVVTLA